MAIENKERKIYGFQFHPEVMHTQHGMEMIKHFLIGISQVPADWNMGQVMEEQLAKIAAQVRLRWVAARGGGSGAAGTTQWHDRVGAQPKPAVTRLPSLRPFCRLAPRTTSFARCRAAWTALWPPRWCTRSWATAFTACSWTTAFCASRSASCFDRRAVDDASLQCASPALSSSASLGSFVPMQEQERVMDMFKNHLHLPVTCVDHSKAMLDRLKGLSDPEAKRKAIGAEFIEVFKAYADELNAKLGKKPKFLVQGTL